MRIKTIVSESLPELEQKVNEFCEEKEAAGITVFSVDFIPPLQAAAFRL
jgi:hypothetical protein